MKQLVVAFVLLVGCTGAIEEFPTDISEATCEEYPLVLHSVLPTKFPINIILDSKLSDHNIGLMLKGIDAWNESMQTEVVYATITDDLTMHDKCNYAVVTDTTDLKPEWIGLTSLGICAAATVNIETMDTKMANRPPEFYTDDLVTTITIHEIGHVLGLDHETDPNSVMFESAGAGDVKRISEQSYCMVKQAVLRTQ